jgi:cysteine-rich repeat protein
MLRVAAELASVVSGSVRTLACKERWFQLGFRPTFRLNGPGKLLVWAVGCSAGVSPTKQSGTAGNTGTAGSSVSGALVSISGAGRGRQDHWRRRHIAGSPRLRDGINNQGGIENCDDGNTIAGDGCNGICHVVRTGPAIRRCARARTHAATAISAGEVRDDRNTADGDGCNATCTVQDPAHTCIPGSLCALVPVETGASSRARTGDDGNATANDGCSASCQVEAVCATPGMPCARAAL